MAESKGESTPPKVIYSKEGHLGSSKDQGRLVETLLSNGNIPILQKLGHQFGVTISILQKEGEIYTHNDRDDHGKPTTHTGSVPKDYSYIALVSQKGDMRDFWNAVNTEKTDQVKLSNPAKT